MRNIRVGCDIVNIARFKKVLKRTPGMRQRIFSPSEEKGASIASLAGVFAAKEAVIKAWGLTAGDWREIEVVKNKTGRPEIELKTNKKIISQDVSISHDGDYSMAVVVFLS